MLRQVLMPSKGNFMVSIPNEYIGQEIEIIIFPTKAEEDVIKSKPKMTWNEFFVKHPPFADFSVERDNADFRRVEL